MHAGQEAFSQHLDQFQRFRVKDRDPRAELVGHIEPPVRPDLQIVRIGQHRLACQVEAGEGRSLLCLCGQGDQDGEGDGACHEGSVTCDAHFGKKIPFGGWPADRLATACKRTRAGNCVCLAR